MNSSASASVFEKSLGKFQTYPQADPQKSSPAPTAPAMGKGPDPITSWQRLQALEAVEKAASGPTGYKVDQVIGKRTFVNAAAGSGITKEQATQLYKEVARADGVVEGRELYAARFDKSWDLKFAADAAGIKAQKAVIAPAAAPPGSPGAAVKSPAPVAPGDDYRINAKGLAGRTGDPDLIKFDNGRLAAFRRLADRGNGLPGGKPDGVVSAKEAADYLAEAQKHLKGAGKADGDKASLSAAEQKAVLTNAQDSYVRPSGNAENIALVDRALSSFSTMKAGDFPTASPSQQIANMLGDGFVEKMLPAWIGSGSLMGGASPVNALFATDNPVAISEKTFTRNMNFMGPKIGGPEGPASKYFEKQFTGKLHTWSAMRGEIALSRPSVSKDGGVVRTGSFTVAVGSQAEVVAEANLLRGDFRYLGTTNAAMQVQYQITTDPKRLQQIMTGKTPAPNPYTLENMKPGDTVTMTVGPYAAVENEGRALLGKRTGRAGADIKYDKTWSVGDRTVVRMIEDKANKNTHVMIFKGVGTQDADVLGVGAIWNPKYHKADPAQKQSPDGAFVRLLGQAKEVRIDNRFNFVELDPHDARKGGGAETFRNIMQNGDVPAGQTGQALPGVLAHGLLDYKELQQSTALQLTGYYESNREWLGPAKSMQVVAQGSLDLFSRVSAGRDLYLRQIHTKSAITDGLTDYDDAVNTEVQFGSGTFKHTQTESEGGETRYTTETQRNSGTGQNRIDYWHTGLNALKTDVVNALTNDLQDQAGGKKPLFQSFRVNTPSGALEGKAALDYLNSHRDNRNQGWFASKIDHVNVRIFTDDNKARETFADFVSKDSHQYFEKNKNMYILTNQQQGSQFIMNKLLGGGGSAGNIMNLAAHGSTQFKEQFTTMSGEDLGGLVYYLQRFRDASGENHTYPIRVEIDAPY